jgi:hypothetical protein
MTLFTGVDLNKDVYWTNINKAIQLSTQTLSIYIPMQQYSAWLKTRYNKAALSVHSFAQRSLSYDDDQVGTKTAADSLFMVFHMFGLFPVFCLAAVVYRDIDCFRENAIELWATNSLNKDLLYVLLTNLKTKFKLNCIQISKSYRAINAPRLGYKN